MQGLCCIPELKSQFVTRVTMVTRVTSNSLSIQVSLKLLFSCLSLSSTGIILGQYIQLPSWNTPRFLKEGPGILIFLWLFKLCICSWFWNYLAFRTGWCRVPRILFFPSVPWPSGRSCTEIAVASAASLWPSALRVCTISQIYRLGLECLRIQHQGQSPSSTLELLTAEKRFGQHSPTMKEDISSNSYGWWTQPSQFCGQNEWPNLKKFTSEFSSFVMVEEVKALGKGHATWWWCIYQSWKTCRNPHTITSPSGLSSWISCVLHMVLHECILIYKYMYKYSWLIDYSYSHYFTLKSLNNNSCLLFLFSSGNPDMCQYAFFLTLSWHRYCGPLAQFMPYSNVWVNDRKNIEDNM